MYIEGSGSRFALRKDSFSGIKRAFRFFSEADAFSFTYLRKDIIKHIKRK